MIKVKRSLFAAAALGLTLVGSSAHAAFSSFWFDPDGASGPATAFLVNEYLGIGGDIRVNNTFSPSSSNFGFTQYGDVRFNSLDGSQFADSLTSGQSTAMNSVGIRFSGSGTGTLSGALSFTSGLVEFFSPTWTQSIGSFAITGGAANVDSTGFVSNGAVTMVAKATSLAAGYFFKDNNGVEGVDLSTDLDGMPVWGFSTTNMTILSGSTTSANNRINNAFANDEVYVDGTAGNTTLFPNGPYTQFFAGVGGQYRMEVPEPESLALMGLGLVALAASRRRKTAK